MQSEMRLQQFVQTCGLDVIPWEDTVEKSMGTAIHQQVVSRFSPGHFVLLPRHLNHLYTTYDIYSPINSYSIEFMRLDLCNTNRVKEHDGYLGIESEHLAKIHRTIKLPKRKLEASVLWTVCQGVAQ